MLDLGRAKRYGTIKRKTTAKTDTGAPVITWVTVTGAWFNKSNVSDAERVRYGEVVSDAAYTLRTHWIADITANMQIVMEEGSETMAITGVIDPDDMTNELLVFAKVLS